MNNLKQILDSLNRYSSYNYQDSIKERLDKTLRCYLEELDKSSIRIRQKNSLSVVKELNRHGCKH